MWPYPTELTLAEKVAEAEEQEARSAAIAKLNLLRLLHAYLSYPPDQNGTSTAGGG